MKKQFAILVGAILAALAVALGAFGAHGLKELLEETGRSSTFETAARYHFYHALAIIVTGLLMRQYKSKVLPQAVWFFISGIILFSGSLYSISTSTQTTSMLMGMVAPLGGLSFMIGWVLIAWSMYKKL
ncbi:MAG TPA: DUF423 domain-containing protein [Cyclobacteriaceae bacterium]|nr:DUF423 domain-containing protein [Cyclobacteriaceae bacterium]